MNNEVVITCAITGAGDTAGKHPDLPITPEQIASSAIDAAKAGAAIVHCHVRDPETGKGTREVKHYAEVVDRIRSADVDVVINLTAGMGGDLEIGSGENPMVFGKATDLVGPMTRLAHVEQLLPEICTLDCGTLNFGDGDYTYIGTPNMLRMGAKRCQELGVKPELEIFDTGHLWFALQMQKEGLLDGKPMFQFCHGIPWGMPAEPALLAVLVNMLPDDAFWTSFAISKLQMPWAAQSMMMGGNVRVGLEDNLYLERGKFATNAQLVEKVAGIISQMGGGLVSAQSVRERLDLKKR